MSEWIDVQQELPRAADINGQGVPYSDEVLVAYTESFLNRRTVSAAIMRGTSWIDRFEDTLEDVTHWMPLLDPPETTRRRHCDYVNCSLPHGHIQSCNELGGPTRSATHTAIGNSEKIGKVGQ